jgi:hypothetical protein
MVRHYVNIKEFSALLDYTNSWYMNMDRKMFNLVVFLDLKKAFDTVNDAGA